MLLFFCIMIFFGFYVLPLALAICIMPIVLIKHIWLVYPIIILTYYKLPLYDANCCSVIILSIALIYGRRKWLQEHESVKN
jgi:hypothetical protein